MPLDFFAAPNLSETAGISPVQPWDFAPAPAALEALRKMPKAARRIHTLKPTTKWQCYTALAGLNIGMRISKTNQARTMAGIVADFDAVCDIPGCQGFLRQLPDHLQPTYLEHSLGGKNRLVWLFSRVLRVVNSEHAQLLYGKFKDALHLDGLLPGYDSSSSKPTQLWTNGGEWIDWSGAALPGDFVFGIAADVGKKFDVTGTQDIPLDIIRNEVQARFPGRWEGDFEIDNLGVRFWDTKADCKTGCQVKPDGMLCFTGPVPFMSWGEIFGFQWADEQRAKNLGKAAEDVYFDGRSYWQKNDSIWVPQARQDVILHLNVKGLSSKIARGRTASDADNVLEFIQKQNRIAGAAPLINYASGLLELDGKRVLNTVSLSFPEMAPGPVIPERDWPWLWHFLSHFFADPARLPLEAFLAHLSRFYKSLLDHTPLPGQSIFICGPRESGKTLLVMKVIRALCGNRSTNPYDWLVGQSAFNDDVFSSTILAINDEESPRSEQQKNTLGARLKGLVANRIHISHAKFLARVAIEWLGRIYVTLNDDPASTGMLPEINSSTGDKVMFFRSQSYPGVFGDPAEKIAKEMPFFARSMRDYVPDPRVTNNTRMGVNSYYDPRILQFSQQQTRSYGLQEIIDHWIASEGSYWCQENTTEWQGTPTQLYSELDANSFTSGVLKNWDSEKMNSALRALANRPNSRVHLSDAESRIYVIKR